MFALLKAKNIHWLLYTKHQFLGSISVFGRRSDTQQELQLILELVFEYNVYKYYIIFA